MQLFFTLYTKLAQTLLYFIIVLLQVVTVRNGL